MDEVSNNAVFGRLLRVYEYFNEDRAKILLSNTEFEFDCSPYPFPQPLRRLALPSPQGGEQPQGRRDGDFIRLFCGRRHGERRIPVDADGGDAILLLSFPLIRTVMDTVAALLGAA